VFVSLLNSLRFAQTMMPYSMKAVAEGYHACLRIQVAAHSIISCRKAFLFILTLWYFQKMRFRHLEVIFS